MNCARSDEKRLTFLAEWIAREAEVCSQRGFSARDFVRALVRRDAELTPVLPEIIEELKKVRRWPWRSVSKSKDIDFVSDDTSVER